MQPTMSMLPLLVLISCASPTLPPAAPIAHAETAAVDPDAKKAAIDGYLTCLHRAAIALDDGVSDPASIGLGVASACDRELRSYAEVVAAGRADFYVRQVEALKRDAPNRATRAVLAERALKRR